MLTFPSDVSFFSLADTDQMHTLIIDKGVSSQKKKKHAH